MDAVKFKVGDLVECIDDDNGSMSVTAGKRYVITEIDAGGFIRVDGRSPHFFEWRFKLVTEDAPVSSVRDTQIGGAHYHTMGIQPYEYSLANGLGALEHTAIKYVSRWRKKNGIEDLKKAIHTIQYLIEYTEKNGMPN